MTRMGLLHFVMIRFLGWFVDYASKSTTYRNRLNLLTSGSKDSLPIFMSGVGQSNNEFKMFDIMILVIYYTLYKPTVTKVNS